MGIACSTYGIEVHTNFRCEAVNERDNLNGIRDARTIIVKRISNVLGSCGLDSAGPGRRPVADCSKGYDEVPDCYAGNFLNN